MAVLDADTRGDAAIILKEMKATQQQIDRFLSAARDVGASRASRRRARPREAA